MTLASIESASRQDAVARPPATPAAAGVPGSWEQALQKRAQAFSWFQAPLSPTHAAAAVTRTSSFDLGVAPTVASSQAARTAPGVPTGSDASSFHPACGRETFQPVATGGGAARADLASRNGADIRLDATPQRVAGSLAPPCGNGRSTLPAPAEAMQEASSQQLERKRSPDPARDAVRVHLEESLEGLTVWIGFDARPASAGVQAARATSALLRATALPARLTGVICNGTETYSSGRFARPLTQVRANHHEEQA